jgi:hypothetical protein
VNDATYTLCDSCACYYDADGNCQSEQPHRADINSEAGTCPQCITTLTRLGVPIVNNLSGGGVVSDTHCLKQDGGKSGPSRSIIGFESHNQKPVQFRPTAQFNFYRSTPPEMVAQGMAATVEEGTAQKLVSVNAGNQFPIASVNRDSRKDGNFQNAA